MIIFHFTNSRFTDKFPDGIESLHSEVSFFEEKLSDDSCKVVFCHNDLLLANIIHYQGNVTFIDYEYAGCNYQGFDIGNHFAEFAGLLCNNCLLKLNIYSCNYIYNMFKYHPCKLFSFGIISKHFCVQAGFKCVNSNTFQISF